MREWERWGKRHAYIKASSKTFPRGFNTLCSSVLGFGLCRFHLHILHWALESKNLLLWIIIDENIRNIEGILNGTQ